MSNKLKKSDEAWESLFEDYSILDEIDKNGFFDISSDQINRIRESRLMAKFDHYVNLPLIFQKNEISILPISRYKYRLGRFKTHYTVNYNFKIEPISFDFPENIETLNPDDLYSESSALNCAFNIGIIEDLFQEKPYYTISGRMSTDSFCFEINNNKIEVNGSQCEIDAGFETENYFLLVEAKNYSVKDFLIRQLYYPYRLWSNKIKKKVIPILMTYSNHVFSFFIYEFKNNLDYNSISLVEQKDYVIGSEPIKRSDVFSIFKNVTSINNISNTPFPQANSFPKVIDLISLLVDKDLTKDEITENYQFDARQTNYYTDAGRYLGLVNKYTNPDTKKVTFCLTKEAKSLLKKRYKPRYLELIKRI